MASGASLLHKGHLVRALDAIAPKIADDELIIVFKERKNNILDLNWTKKRDNNRSNLDPVFTYLYKKF